MEIAGILAVIFAVLTLVPVLTGNGIGALVGAVVDLVKLAAQKAGNPLPDGSGGKIALVLNALVFIGLFVILGTNPANVELDAETLNIIAEGTAFVVAVTEFVEVLPPEAIAALMSVFVAAVHFISQLTGGVLMHKVLSWLAPDWFSLSGPDEGGPDDEILNRVAQRMLDGTIISMEQQLRATHLENERLKQEVKKAA